MIKWFFRILRVFFWSAIAVALLAVIAFYYPEKFLCVDSGKVSADAIVVLGGGSYERPQRAVELFKQNAAPKIFLTGEGDDLINRKILMDAGISAAVIRIENQSINTAENAQFTIKLLRAQKIRSVILVTSWYHSRRALKTFEHFAPEIKFYARPSYFAFDRADWKKLGINKRMRLEFLKLPGYWIRYGVNPF